MAAHTHQVVAEADGYLTELDALSVGVASWRLGAGRAAAGEAVQAEAGIELHAKIGDPVRKGQPLMTLHTQTPERFERALESLVGGYTIGESAPTPRESVVFERLATDF